MGSPTTPRRFWNNRDRPRSGQRRRERPPCLHGTVRSLRPSPVPRRRRSTRMCSRAPRSRRSAGHRARSCRSPSFPGRRGRTGVRVRKTQRAGQGRQVHGHPGRPGDGLRMRREPQQPTRPEDSAREHGVVSQVGIRGRPGRPGLRQPVALRHAATWSSAPPLLSSTAIPCAPLRRLVLRAGDGRIAQAKERFPAGGASDRLASNPSQRTMGGNLSSGIRAKVSRNSELTRLFMM